MTVRKATIQDIPDIQQLIFSNQDTLIKRSEDEIEKIIDHFYVKIADKKIVGCCCLEIYSPKIAEIRSVAVADDYRMHGFGTELVEAAVEEANKHNIMEIMVVTSNPEFFKKLDFTTCLNEKYALFWNNPKLAAKRR
jgi:amino-acid N-acetyltransferase